MKCHHCGTTLEGIATALHCPKCNSNNTVSNRTMSNQSKTPRTDAAEQLKWRVPRYAKVVAADFARQLETELEVFASLEKQAQARIQELEKDKAMLDWLEKDNKINDWIFSTGLTGKWFITEPHVMVYARGHESLRSAITEAMKQENK
jgi:hypothetical protein